MKTISGLLKRFKNLEAPDRVIKDAAIKAVEVIIGIKINKEDIKINNKVLFITTSSSIKAAIFENKDTILSRINNLLNKDQILNIK